MSHNQLDMLTDLARDARDQAGKLLAQERQNQQHKIILPYWPVEPSFGLRLIEPFLF